MSFIYPTGYRLIAGTDEVGRGALVGNVVAAAVILDPDFPIHGLKDSKKISDKKRQQLANQIRMRALCWAIAQASPEEIDQLNILYATMLAMHRAVCSLVIMPDLVLVDGEQSPVFNCDSQAIVKGDSLVAEISAASIIAKVARDKQMSRLDSFYPNYQFAKHKGYPTPVHLRLLTQLGPTAQHRYSFKPIQKALLGPHRNE